MLVKISAKQLEVSETLKEYINDKINKGVGKYFKSAISAELAFEKQRHLITTHILIHEGVNPDKIIQSEAEADDLQVSFDFALEKALKQLRRFKRKITNHKGENRKSLRNVADDHAA